MTYYQVTYKNVPVYEHYSSYDTIFFSALRDDKKDKYGNLLASIKKYERYQLTREEWWKNGQKHRLFYPAIIHYDMNFNISNGEWWIKGKRYKNFNKYKYLILQILIKFLYFNSKNVNVWSPKNLGGKCTKKFLMKLITKN
jgi:hypothetical protein